MTLTLAFTAAAFAQQAPGGGSVINFNPQMVGGSYQGTDHGSFKKNDAFNGIEGSFYLYKIWNFPAVIETENGKTFKINNLNYDLDEEKFLSKISNDSVYFYENLKRIVINKDEFNQIDGNYYQKLSAKGNLTLLKKYSGKLKKPVLNKMTNQVLKPAKYLKVETYFVAVDGDKLIEVSLKKSKVMKLMAAHKKEIKAFVKTHRLSFKKEADVIKIINHYNSL